LVAELHMARDVLDKLLRDKNGRECGRVDSVIIKVRPGQPAIVTEMECGIFIALRRVNAGVAEWLAHVALRVLPLPLGSVKLSIDKFSHEGQFIELPIDSEADRRLMRAEKWLRTHVIERIPGGASKKPGGPEAAK
jgi:hypothetical protein